MPQRDQNLFWEFINTTVGTNTYAMETFLKYFVLFEINFNDNR